MIEVILLERIERLGQLGQVVKVRPGFARNFLLPHKKALRATKSNLELFEKQRAELEAKNVALRAEAEKEAKRFEGVKLVLIRQASEAGHLFGSVTARDVSESAKQDGHVIDRQQVQIDTPIKALGLFQVKIKLHPEVVVKITLNVARSKEEAVAQAEKGAALVKAEAKAAADEAKAAADLALVESTTETEVKAAETEEAPKKAKKPRAKKAGTEE